MILFLCLLSRLISFISRTLHAGTGVAWSGEIAMFLDPKIFAKLIPPGSKVVLIAGTNGKTTTAKMIQEMGANHYNVIHNDTGANLQNGLVGTILVKSPLIKKKKTAFVFEIDESNLPIVLQTVIPDILVLLNLFRDQLDRYGEVDTISKSWLSAFLTLDLKKTTLIVNGDDPNVSYIAIKAKEKVKSVQSFGINDKSLYLESEEHAVDSIFCPNCGERLKFEGVYLSHLGLYHCPKCNFTHPKLNLEASKVETSLSGLYMVYNALAAALAGKELGVPSEEITTALKNFKPAFGRQEEIQKNGKTIKVLLSKNPAGFNASLRTAIENNQQGPLLFVLNDQIPDGRDVSWIWDVDFEMLAKLNKKVSVAGDRAFDLALRLKYAEIPAKINTLEESLQQTKPEETLWILPTYSAMLEIRKSLTGKKIL